MKSAWLSNSKYAIVGGGLMGRLLALALAKGGAQVDLLKRVALMVLMLLRGLLRPC